MMAAAESGARAKQAAHTQYTQSGERSLDRALRTGESLARTVEESRRADLAEKDQGERSGLAERRQGLAETDAAHRRGMQERQQEFHEKSTTERTDLSAADKGLERRKAGVESEMQRGAEQMGPTPGELRGEEQRDKPLESDGQGGFVKTEERKLAEKSGAELTSYKAQTARMQAESYRMQVANTYNKARLLGDSKAMAASSKELQKGWDDIHKMNHRFGSGLATEKDWTRLQVELVDNPDPALQRAIQARDLNDPRLKEVMQAKADSETLKFIASTGGDLPKSLSELYDLDFSSKTMQKFTSWAELTGQKMKTNGVSQILGFRSQKDSIRFRYAMAAQIVMAGFDIPGQGQMDESFLPPALGEAGSGAPQGAPVGSPPDVPGQRAVQTGMRQGMDAQGNPATPPVQQGLPPGAPSPESTQQREMTPRMLMEEQRGTRRFGRR